MNDVVYLYFFSYEFNTEICLGLKVMQLQMLKII